MSRPAEKASTWLSKGLVRPSSAFATSSGDKPKSKAASRSMKQVRADPGGATAARFMTGTLGDYCFRSIFSITSVLYKSPSSTLPSMANTQSIPPFGAE